MNVLVYAGPGASQSALKHTLSSLRSLLVPNYSIQTVQPEALSSDVWCSSCALLVLPGGRDVLYLTSLESANRHIKKYVNSGGKYLGICAGAYYASTNIEWEVGRPGMEVTGPRPLRFFPGLSKGCVYPGFEYSSESGARSITVLSGGHEYHGLYYNGGGEFVNAAQHETVEVLASYRDGEDASMAAGVTCFDGKGMATLWGVHLEYSLFEDPLNALLVAAGVSQQQKSEWEKDRIQLLRDTLSSLGLTLPAQDRRDYSRPHPQYFVCSPELGNTPSSIAHDILTHNRTTSACVLPDENDTFHFHEQDIDLRSKLKSQYGPPSSSLEIELRGPKHIILCDSKPPTIQETPYFHITIFFDFLKKARWKLSLPYPSQRGWGIGSLLLYSEAVTSTQTLLDKNPTWLNALPAPLMSLATHQMSGRGRGGNVWLSPAGCLQFSLLLKVSCSPGTSPFPYLKASSLVFVQYLMGLAVVAACRSLLGASGDTVRLKWPNDIYGIVGETKKKLGGIIVSTSFSDGTIAIVVGCGTNVFNDQPTTSLSALRHPNSPPLVMEEVAASIASQFENRWAQFLHTGGSFKPFMDEYLDFWLHSDEVVTITTTNPPTKVRIIGITTDHGLLRTVPLSEEWNLRPTYVDLQPDGNSFDIMAGLIRAKS